MAFLCGASSQSPTDSPTILPKPICIGSERLATTYASQPPSDLHGYFNDGIEYYCCANHNCKSVWAKKWTLTPRRNLVSRDMTPDAYKAIAVAKICNSCKDVIREADAQRKKASNEYKLKIQQAWPRSPSRYTMGVGDSFAHNSMPWSTEGIADSNETTCPDGDKGAASPDSVKNTGPLQIGLKEALAANNGQPLEDVRLTPPPAEIEELAMLAVKDPSWDVVDKDDAEEDWAIINHFGNAALQHRDAHVDTPTVLP